MSEEKIIGYTRDSKGKVVSHHLQEHSNTLHCGGGSTMQYVLLPDYDYTIAAQRGRGEKNIQRMEQRKDGLTNTITTVAKDNYLISMKRYRVRKLTERECLRLQGLNEQEIETICSCGVSRSQIYKQAGNSICVPCLTHIFRKMFVDTGIEEKNVQLSLF